MTCLRKYTDLRVWLRSLLKSSVNAGVGALLAGGGSNALEGTGLSAVSGIGLDWRQMVGVFASAAFIEALRRIQAATAQTHPAIAPHSPPPAS